MILRFSVAVVALGVAMLAALLARQHTTAAPLESSQQWVTVNKDYASQRYVDLDQITPQNVGGLKEACEFRLNEAAWFSSGLLMVGRTIYVDTMRATYAIDAGTCALRWRTVLKFGVPANISNRGPAYLDGMIFRGTVDGRVVALDAKTGNVMWDKQYADPKEAETFVAAPIAWNGKVFIGISISDLGIHGRMLAIDAKTGKEIWRFYTVPPGNNGDNGKTWGGLPLKPGVGGGGFWTSFSLDPATNDVFIPVANPAPDFDIGVRPGENLYTDSVVALNADTGKVRWYHQIAPYDDHDWDVSTAPTLYRTRSGKDMVAEADKTGFVTGIDRKTNAVVFHTPGTTILNNGPLRDTLTLTCPGLGGGAQFNGAAYQPKIGALYIGMVDWCSYYKKPAPAAAASQAENGAAKGALDYDYGGAVFVGFQKQPRGWITALDGESGRILWKYQTDGQMLAGLVPTKSGLLFAGDVRGNLFAFNARNGTVLDHLNVDGALNSGLISYAVDGKQYVAAAVGGTTLNPAGVSGALKISVYGLSERDSPDVVTADRLPPQATEPAAASAERYILMCSACHGNSGQGRTYPSLLNHPELADPNALANFLATVPPPMPRLFPGPLNMDDVRMIADYMKIITHAPTPEQIVAALPESHWTKIYSVLSSPRCLNCHTMTDFPRQTDLRYAHIYGVMRGPDDRGLPQLRCDSCHGAMNNPVTGIPGAPNWHTAPLSMAWESAPRVALSSSALCARLKDKARNGNRDLAALEHHIATDHLVLWGWSPGSRPNGDNRLTPPLSHEQFVQDFKEWTAEGAPCPTN